MKGRRRILEKGDPPRAVGVLGHQGLHRVELWFNVVLSCGEHSGVSVQQGNLVAQLMNGTHDAHKFAGGMIGKDGREMGLNLGRSRHMAAVKSDLKAIGRIEARHARAVTAVPSG